MTSTSVGSASPATVSEISLTIPAATLGPLGLPLLRRGHEVDMTDKDRELLGTHPDYELVGRPTSVLPYRSQNHYGREVTDREFRGIELANEHVRAVFLPELGGRLWNLVDIASGKDLLFQPDAIWYGNLALRDAWASGGIEWNLGTTGHWGLTCDPVAAGIVEVDGEQVLRMWAFERLTGLVWRLEAWLPADSRHLYVSARIENHRQVEVPFYWWSNAAVPLTDTTRVLAPASEAFHHEYDGRLSRISFPEFDGVDGSRPAEAPTASDYFFISSADDGTPADHPWVANWDADGPGTLLASSRELSGKKLFVWGNTRGGHRWQGWLNGTGQYVEIQSGRTRIQREHARFAPGQTISWVEAIGPVDGSVPAGFDDAVDAVAAQLPADGIRRARALFDSAADVAPRVLQQPDGWGRVEVEAGHLPANPATPFDVELTPEQQAWVEFARTGTFDDSMTHWVQVGAEWQARIEAADESWLRQLLLGMCAWARSDRAGAVEHWEASLALQTNAMSLYCLSVASDDEARAAELAHRAHLADPSDDDLLAEHLARAGGNPADVVELTASLGERQRSLPRVRLAEARALVAVGRLEDARMIIDDIELPNLREASDDLGQLWAAYCEAAGTAEPIPPHLDFAMR